MLRALLALLLLPAGMGCSVGDGVGEASGTIHVPECDLEGAFDRLRAGVGLRQVVVFA